MIENLIAYHDKSLIEHLMRYRITSQVQYKIKYLFQILQTQSYVSLLVDMYMCENLLFRILFNFLFQDIRMVIIGNNIF